ncbi:MAG: bifunctional folylpolyglutamate synthase/dihydrofolate synthase [Bacteroidia bacterium]|nr:bifunctional folylpolyglutamate synthase/dihydrofolate synthase [Bacteroidia bacterium]
MQSYDNVIQYLYDHLPYYQRSGPAAYKDNLDNTNSLDEMFDHPHLNFKSVHVAGTNGKGSVSHMMASILMEAGYKTGLYTSPHLKDFRERIRINGGMIKKKFVVEFVEEFLRRNHEKVLEPSFFELTVMLAFDYFSKNHVDIAIIEVGLGGRLDSTNIIRPELSVITNISYDHMALLGDTLGKIALEKAGIIKRGVPVVIGETHAQTSIIFNGISKEMSAPIVFADQHFDPGYALYSTGDMQIFNIRKGGKVVFGNLKLDLLGRYQSKNICTVLAVVEQLRELGWKIPEIALRNGLEKVVENTGLLGRWQVIGANPRIICDTGHNEGGIREVVAQIKETPYKRLHFVIGMVNDKDISGVLRLLPKDAIYYFTKASIPRALDENQMMKMAAYFNLQGSTYPSVAGAFAAARKNAGPDDLIFVGGSTFVVAEVLEN